MALWNNKAEDTAPPEKHAPPRTATPTARPTDARGGSVLGPGLQVDGKLEGSDDVRLEGPFVGEAHLPKGQLTVAQSGEVRANLTARVVLVEGKVVGDVRGIERVIVRKGAKVEGNIAAPRVILEDGCRVTGAIDMGKASPGKSQSTTPPGGAVHAGQTGRA